MRRIITSAAVLGLIAIIFYVENWLTGLSFAEEETTELSLLQQKQVDLFMEMNRLLTTLATLVVGALGAVLAHRYGSGHVPRPRLFWAGAAALLSGLSLVAGYTSFRTAMWMMNIHFFNLFAPQVEIPARLQFLFFLLAVAAFTKLLFEEARNANA